MTRQRPSLRLLVFAYVITVLFFAAPVIAQQRQTLGTSLAAPAGTQLIGPLPGTQQLSLALTLALQNESDLDNLLTQLYDPASPNYHQFLSVQEFTDRYSPTTDDYSKVIAFAAANGLTVTNTSPNRLVVDVTGTVSSIEQAFQVQMLVYQHPTENRTFYAPDREPSVEAGLAVQGISGLNNFDPPRPMLKYAPAGMIFNTTGSGPDGQFLGSDMRAAYAPGVTLTGAGQVLGLFEFGPYNMSDVTSYFRTIKQPLNVPIVNVLLDGVNGICGAGCDDG